MKHDIVEVGNRIFIARKNKGLKQIEISKQLGIGQSTYSAIENGRTDIHLSVLFALADILDVSVTWLIGEDDIEYTNSELLEIEKFKKYLLSIRK